MLGETMSETPSDGVSVLQTMQQTKEILADDTKRILAGRVLGLGSVVVASVVGTVASSIVGILSRSLGCRVVVVVKVVITDSTVGRWRRGLGG